MIDAEQANAAQAKAGQQAKQQALQEQFTQDLSARVESALGRATVDAISAQLRAEYAAREAQQLSGMLDQANEQVARVDALASEVQRLREAAVAQRPAGKRRAAR